MVGRYPGTKAATNSQTSSIQVPHRGTNIVNKSLTCPHSLRRPSVAFGRRHSGVNQYIAHSRILARRGGRAENESASGPRKRKKAGETEMKKFLLGTVGSGRAGRGCARVGRRSGCPPLHQAPPMVAAVYDWSGFYSASTAAGDRAASAGTSDAGGAFAPRRLPRCNRRTVGGQIGYRWQAAVGVRRGSSGRLGDFQGCNVSLFFPAFTNDTRVRPSACSPARSVTPSTTRCSTSRAAPR